MRAGSCGGPESMEGETQRDERGGRLRFSVFGFKSMRKTAREKRVKHINVMYIFTEERIGEGECFQPAPFSEYEIIWSITHLKTLLCAMIHCTSSRQRLFFFLSGRIPSELHCLFCPMGSISVTCQRQLQSLYILHNYQVSG